MFIKLTELDNSDVYVNVNTMIAFTDNRNNTSIVYIPDGTFSVKETSKQIHQLLTESYVTVKESHFKEEG